MQKQLYKIILILIIIIISLIFTNCKKNIDKKKKDNLILNKKIKILLKTDTNYYDNNKIIFNLKSKTIKDEINKNFITIIDIKTCFYNKSGKEFIKIESKKAKMLKNKKDIYFYGKSKIFTKNGKGFASKLKYIHKKRVITGKNLIFKGKDLNIKANYFYIYPDKDLIILKDNIKIKKLICN